MITSILVLTVSMTPGTVLAGSAKILLYHHVSTETPASTSITPERFEAHLALIASQGYQVVPLATIVDALISERSIDDRWIAITFDDAYRSVRTEAVPRLTARGWPFTVFASTDSVEAGLPPYLGWDDLRALEDQGGTIANHSASHAHLVESRHGESPDERRTRLTRVVVSAQQALEAELRAPARFFAYPYGEFDESLAGLLRELGFIAFGQQSGPVGNHTGQQSIPRFPLASGFDAPERLAEKLKTVDLPVSDPVVPATVLASGDAPAPTLTLTLSGGVINPGSLTCFVGGQPQATVRWLDAAVVEIQAPTPLPPGRTRYTCTAPDPRRAGAYYWHTHLFMKPNPDGSWYDG